MLGFMMVLVIAAFAVLVTMIVVGRARMKEQDRKGEMVRIDDLWPNGPSEL